MKIIFFGNATFGLPTLNCIHESKHDLVAVVTNKDKPSGRGNKITSTPIKEFALDNNLPLIEAENLLSKELIRKIEKLSPDLIIVIAFKLLPEKIFNIPKHGTMNLHASLLPKYRGAAPIHRAILNGDSKTGVSTFIINKKIDTGKLILQKEIILDPTDNFKSIHDKLSVVGSELVINSISHIIHKQPLVNQIGATTYAKKISKEELQINWNKDANIIINKIRAFSPYPCAYTYLNKKRVKIYFSKINKSKILRNFDNGCIQFYDNRMFVSTNTYPIEILELQLEGKRKTLAFDFINGFLNTNISDLKFEFKN